MEEINLLPNPRRSLAIFRGHPLATCCVDCGEDSEVPTANNIGRSVNTNLQYRSSNLVTTDGKTMKKVELGETMCNRWVAYYLQLCWGVIETDFSHISMMIVLVFS